MSSTKLVVFSEEDEYEDEELTDEMEEERNMEETHHTAVPSPLRQPRFVYDYYDSTQSQYPRAATTVSATASPRSPLLKKFSPIQDRRVNTILLEALQLVDFSKEELVVIEKSIKRLRDAIHGFSMLVDKQVNIIGAESLEERGRVKADIQDLCENLKTSNALLDSTCARMKKCLASGKNQLHVHKRKIVGKTASDLIESSENEYTVEMTGRPPSPSRILGTQRGSDGKLLNRTSPASSPCSSPSYSNTPTRQTSPVISKRKSPNKVPLAAILDSYTEQNPVQTVYVAPDFFWSVLETVGLSEKEFLDTKDLVRFMHEMLTLSIARSNALTFMGKAHHRKLILQYAKEIVRLIVDELQLIPQTSTNAIMMPQNTFFDYMCTAPFRFHALLHDIHVNNPSTNEDLAKFYKPTAFQSAAESAALNTFPPNPFADQLSKNGGVLNGGAVVSLVVNRTEPELLEAAEQTLNIAKLLHDLATADSEAKHGNRLSIRPHASKSNEFSKAYIATSKELLQKESVFH